MKCSVCGTDSKGDARFCAGCGATLIIPTFDETLVLNRPPVFSLPVAAPVAPSTTRGADPTRTNIGGLVLVVIALGVIGYFVYRVATTFGMPSTASVAKPAKSPAKPAEPVRQAPPTTPSLNVTEPPRVDAVAPGSATTPPAAPPVPEMVLPAKDEPIFAPPPKPAAAPPDPPFR